MTILLEIITLLLLSSFVFDLVHYFLHRLQGSSNPLIKKVTEMHLDHHRFFDENLKINEGFRRKNFLNHVIPETGTAILVILLGGFFVSNLALIICLGLQVVFFALNTYWRGEDPHHREGLENNQKGFFSFWVQANYHRLHHIYPHRYFSSYHRVLDWILGSGHHLEEKRFCVSGTSSGLGKEYFNVLGHLSKYPVKKLKHGIDFNGLQVFSKEKLKDVDVLVLSHGNREPDVSMSANYWSYVNLIEAFRKICEEDGRLPEVWAVGSEIEFHPSFGVKSYQPYMDSKRAFQKVARYYSIHPKIVYRHIVPAAFRSNMGWGFMSARSVARASLFLIKRQLHYIPITYTGFAILNYFKFYFLSYQKPRELYQEAWFDPDLARCLENQISYSVESFEEYQGHSKVEIKNKEQNNSNFSFP